MLLPVIVFRYMVENSLLGVTNSIVCNVFLYPNSKGYGSAERVRRLVQVFADCICHK